jgi:hypothetical protein
MEFYSAIKKNEILSSVGKWMELANIILSEVSQVPKARGHMFSLIHGIWAQYKYKQYYKKTGHGKGRSHRRKGGKNKEVKEMNMVDAYE